MSDPSRSEPTGSRSIIDIYRDATRNHQIALRKDKTNTLRLKPARPVSMAEVPGAAFRPGGAALQAGAPDGSGSPLPAIAAALIHVKERKQERLLVAAHCEDRELSARRAEVALRFVRADRDGFAAACHEVATVFDWQQALKWVAAVRGWPCDPGDVDGKVGPKTNGALAECRRRWAAAFERTAPAGSISAGDWAMFFDLYDAALAQLIDEPRGPLAARRAALPLVARPAVGCGGAWPPASCKVQQHVITQAERVDLLFFEEKDVPKLDCHGPGGDATVCDVYRKQKYRAMPLATAPAPVGPMRVRLLGLLFETDKTFLLPGSLRAIKALKRLHDKRPPGEVLVVGHTDTAGKRDWNLTLSERRAEAVGAYLRDEVEPWAAWYGQDRHEKQRWGVREDKHMLSHRKGDDGLPFYGGDLDSKVEPGYTGALMRFQAWSNAHQGTALKEDGKVTADTRRALIKAYMSEDGTTLPPGTSAVTHGCGEHHPAVETGDEQANEENRRVEVFLFSGAATPPPGKCPSPAGCGEYAAWIAATTETIDLRDDLATLEVRVIDQDGVPVADAEVKIDGRGADAGRTDAQGVLVLADELPGAYKVIVRKQGHAEAEAEAQAPGAIELQLVRVAPAIARPPIPGTAFLAGTSCPGPGAYEHVRWLQLEGDLGPDRKLRVFAHTSEAGSDQANKALSDRRARAIKAVLTHDLAAFDALAAEERWPLRVYQAMLRGLGCDPGPIDGKPGTLTTAALRGFQRDYREGVYHDGAPLARPGLPIDGQLTPDTEAALRDAYLRWGVSEGPALPQEAFVGPGDGCSGCAGFNPAEGDGPTGRVEVALFVEPPPGEFPCTAGDAAACKLDGGAPSRCRFYREVLERPAVRERPPFFELRWHRERGAKTIRLSALSSLPDGTKVQVSVHRPPAPFESPPPTSSTAHERPDLGDSLGSAAAEVQAGVVVAHWTPAGPDPLDWSEWIVDQERHPGGPAMRPPVFVVTAGDVWAVSPPPGLALEELRFGVPGAAKGMALLADGQLMTFTSRDGLVRAPHVVVAIKLEGHGIGAGA